VGSDVYKRQVSHDALAAAAAVRDGLERARTFVFLVPYLPEWERRNAWLNMLEAVGTISDDYSRALALASIIRYLPEVEQKIALDNAFAAASAVVPTALRADALIELVPLFPLTEREAVADEAFAAAKAISDDYGRARALAALGMHLPDTSVFEALDAAEEISNQYARADALAELNERALTILDKIVSEFDSSLTRMLRNVDDQLRTTSDDNAQLNILNAELSRRLDSLDVAIPSC